MKSLIAFFIRNPVWTNVLMLAILGFGFLSLLKLKTSFFPETESEIINIEISYPGASPEETEKGLTLKIEENLEGMMGIERITSVSSENSSRLVVYAFEDYDMQKLLSDVKNAVDRISPYPEGAEKPVVYLQEPRSRSVSVALSGNADLWALKEKAELFREDLIAEEGVSQVSLQGIPGREISIEIKEETLRQYQLTFPQVAASVRSANIDISGGKIETLDEEILIRAYKREYYADDLKNIVVKSDPSGSLVRLKDVASVVEKWEDTPNRTYVNGQRAVIINIEKTLAEDILYVKDKVYEAVEKFNETNSQVKLSIIEDATLHLQGRIDLLTSNGIFGFFLVALSLWFFLNWRIAFWVAMGIPVSFAGMFIIASLVGITINVMSLFGMILVVGILVDDAIVVSENVYQKYEKGMSPFQAALQGTLEVLAPVFTAVSTTVMAFLPFFFFQGTFGKFVWQIGFVVIAAIVMSLLESIILLPSHLAHSKGIVKGNKPNFLRTRFEKGYQYVSQEIYGKWLVKFVEYRYFVILIPLFLFSIVFGLIKGGKVEFSPFPHIDRDNIALDLTMVSGTQEERTDSILKVLEGKMWAVHDSIKQAKGRQDDVFLSIRRDIGSNAAREAGGHAGQLRIDFISGEERGFQAFEIGNIMREKLGNVPGAQKISLGGGNWGKPVTISLLGNDKIELEKAVSTLKEKLKGYPALKDIVDNNSQGRREIMLELKPKALTLGFNTQQIATQIREGFFGHDVQRLQRSKDEIRVWVRYPVEDRASLTQFENMRIQDKQGNFYPLNELVKYTIDRGVVNIVHLDGKREIRVEADFEDPNTSSTTILQDIKANIIPPLLKTNPGVRVSYEGQSRDFQKFLNSVKSTFPLALLGIFVILILVFKSYLQASLIFIIIPTALIGAVYGHYIHGIMLSQLSIFGIIALTGIVINDSIVFLDQINRNLSNGLKVVPSIIEAGISRLRAISLTTITTVLGLGPLIFETSRQAKFLIPMAVSIAYGLLLGSFLILFVVPALFMVLNDIRYFTNKIYNEVLLASFSGNKGKLYEIVTETFGLILEKPNAQMTRESVEPAVQNVKVSHE